MQTNLFDPTWGDVNAANVGAIEGLQLLENFIGEGEERFLLDQIDSSPWLDDLSRRVQHYGYKYDYRARRIDDSMHLGPLPKWADRIGKKMHGEGLIPELPDQMIVNEYLPGQGISAHIDCEPCFGPTIASLSLGSPAVMEFSLSYPSKLRVPVLLTARSLVILSGPSRSEWRHAIPGRKKDRFAGMVFSRQRRVSMTFRKVMLP